jgi:ubiquinone/menaquinone biosynthesis C-methylase UbiE
MNRFEAINLYKQKNPDWKIIEEFIVDVGNSIIVNKNITDEYVLLDAGCGRISPFESLYTRATRVIGVDIDKSSLDKNELIKEKYYADLVSIPLPDESVDIITCAWVAEHLEFPEKVFHEFSRILKKGGKILIVTPNKLNWIVWGYMFTPYFLHKMLVKKFYLRDETDTFRTFYRANTETKLRKLSENHEMKLEKCHKYPDPSYMCINKFFFGIACFIEKRILSLPILKNGRIHLVAVVKKN